LRIRKRFSAFPNKSFADAFVENAQKHLKQVSLTQRIVVHNGVINNAVNSDVRNDEFRAIGEMFDVAITSPPYATALPYIDTQRLSLVWLELCDPRNIMKLESTLIGSREMYNGTKQLWKVALECNDSKIPISITNTITEMQTSIAESDGFRKQAVPLLLYRYFADMKNMFENMTNILYKNAFFALVVGRNKTTLGTKDYNINTPELLVSIACSTGWELIELFPLQTYQRYGLNKKNAINSETLIILRNARQVG
jgi:site-specific DNA-methyltransferase (cytosine-N4-specific)